MNFKALHKLSYGIQIVTTVYNHQKAGYIANTAFQVTSKPAQLAISAHKDNLTTDLIEQSGVFAVSVLEKEPDLSLIGRFGFESSSDIDKFEGLDIKTSETEAPIVLNNCVAWFDCRITHKLDLGTHILFVGEILDMAISKDTEPLTYQYYREKYKMMAPKNAPTYIPPADTEIKEDHSHTKEDMVRVGNKWICTICGYVYDPAEGDPTIDVDPGTSFEDLPEDYKCPICNAGKEFFEQE